MSEQFRVGDVLTVSCPFTESEVAELRPGYAAIKWPWHRVDPDTPQFRWNGQRAISTDPNHVDWKHELFRTEPAPRHLKVGMVCRVGIPLTVVHVIDIAAFDPPQKNGMLPRPSLLLGVLPAGQTEEPGYEDQGSSINRAFLALRRPLAMALRRRRSRARARMAADPDRPGRRTRSGRRLRDPRGHRNRLARD